MTKQEWLNYAIAHRAKLVLLLNAYHPRSFGMRSVRTPITAHNAEIACNVVRNVIRERDKHLPNPVEQFNQAIDADNWVIVNSLLNDAWFGVPESTSCWNIEGYTEAVTLIEEPPDEA